LYEGQCLPAEFLDPGGQQMGDVPSAAFTIRRSGFFAPTARNPPASRSAVMSAAIESPHITTLSSAPRATGRATAPHNPSNAAPSKQFPTPIRFPIIVVLVNKRNVLCIANSCHFRKTFKAKPGRLPSTPRQTRSRLGFETRPGRPTDQ
jgi:hypothetical protein